MPYGYEVVYKHKTFNGTRAEFNALPSNGEYYCPDCGLATTEPYPSCGCPTKVGALNAIYTVHINRWHHNCEHAWKEAYGKRR